MIITRLMGGLGNQMFQYAFGLFTAQNNNTYLKIDTTLLQKPKSHNSLNIYRDYELEKVFDIHCKHATPFEVELYNGDSSKSLLRRAVFKLLRKLYGAKTYVQTNHNYNNEQLTIHNNTCLVGRWQSEKYFTTIEKEVRKHFTFKNPISNEYQHYLRAIENSSNATCLHIRRTDYINHPVYSKKIGALTDEYYSNAIQALNNLIDKPQVFIFSDEIDNSKEMLKNLRITNELTFIDVALPNPHDELQLMTLCKHHIISNSTYSWWGAWLSTKDGFTLAPKKWSLDPDFSSEFILPDTFIKIPC